MTAIFYSFDVLHNPFIYISNDKSYSTFSPLKCIYPSKWLNHKNNI